MSKKLPFIIFLMLISAMALHAQTNKSNKAIDSLIDYDALFSELDNFFDSLYTPKSFAIINIGASNGYYNYQSSGSTLLTSATQITVTPSIGFYHKSGPGFNLAAAATGDGAKLNVYQFAASASYDYLQNRKVIGGISLTHFFTKDSLPFYTSPLQNEAYAYVSIRKWWVRPTLSVSYGRGSKSNYEERKEYITALRLRPSGYTRVNSTESISDFTVTASVKHDFYWLHTLIEHDYFRITPQISFTGGTQKYGFNQSTETYNTHKGNNKSILYNSENVSLSNSEKFAPLNATATLKAEYSIGKFFLQPLFLVDCYLPASNKKIATSFAINAGVIL